MAETRTIGGRDMTCLYLQRLQGETWRDALIRIAKHYYLEEECLEVFDREIAEGVPEDRAAWNAAYEWDVLSFDPGDGT